MKIDDRSLSHDTTCDTIFSLGECEEFINVKIMTKKVAAESRSVSVISDLLRPAIL